MNKKKSLSKSLGTIVIVISLFFTGFQVLTATRGLLTALLQRGIHLTFVLMLVFFLFPSIKNKKLSYIMDLPLILLSLFNGIYLYFSFEDLMYRVGEPNTFDVFFGVTTILILLEATRRTVGYTMTILGILSILYCFLGQYIPEPVGHSGRDLDRIISQIYLSTEGIYGIPLGVAATYVFLFILFGSFMEKSGAGNLFINLANAFAGRYAGGPAKIAIISSASMGMVSGSPVSDAATTGAFTIPLMKKVGYKSTIAAAFEASASSGASLVPPIMGAGAFIMADISGVPYSKIILHAIIPAFLYYFALMLIAGNEARKNNLVGLAEEEIPSKKDALMNSLRLLIPLVVLILSLAILRVSPLRAALFSTGIILLTTFFYNIFKPSLKVPISEFYEALYITPRKILTVSVACATAGIIIGMLGLTGLGLKLSDILMAAANGKLFIALIFAMIISIVLGMGLPPTASYIVMAVTAAPALIQMGVNVLVAHFFVFIYCCYAPITPPVALAAYTTSGIAGCDPFKAGLESFRISLSGFIIPFLIVYGNALLGFGVWYEILWAFVTASIGVWALSIAIVGWYHKKVSIIWRILLGISGPSFMIPGIFTDMAGALVLIIFILKDRNYCKKCIT